MTTGVDEYLSKVIQLGDEGSDFLNKRCAPTLKNSEFVDVLDSSMGGQRVLRIPDEYYVVVHSAAGDPGKTDLKEHSASLIDRLVEQARVIGATPVAMANVIDASKGERSDLECVVDGMTERANHHKVAIMTGELAILGEDIITKKANVSGTMISIIPKTNPVGMVHTTIVYDMAVPGIFSWNNVQYALFDPGGKAVSINSDGVGTKVKWLEMLRAYNSALYDSTAMKVDDSAKSGAKVIVISDTVETTRPVEILNMQEEAKQIGKKLGAKYILQAENVGDRLRSYNGRAVGFNVSGSAVCVIDEDRLRNPLKPGSGEYVIAIRGKPNPRSNGITSKRKIINEMGKEWCKKHYVEEWHETFEGKEFLDYLAEPSTILYPVFMDSIKQGLATSVYHMSGGAYNGKFARPLAKNGLFARIEDIFSPNWREMAMVKFANVPMEKAYAQWPMGNDGFITTTNPDEAIKTIQKHGLEARAVGRVETAVDGKTGVELAGIDASNGQNVYFSGRD